MLRSRAGIPDLGNPPSFGIHHNASSVNIPFAHAGLRCESVNRSIAKGQSELLLTCLPGQCYKVKLTDRGDYPFCCRSGWRV